MHDPRQSLHDAPCQFGPRIASTYLPQEKHSKAGTLRIGFVESISWHGVVPDSFRRFRLRQPDAELELHPMLSAQQAEAVGSGMLDAGFIFSLIEPDRDFGHLLVAQYKLMLAAPQGHAVTRIKRLRLRDLRDAPFIWFHRWANPIYYDRIMQICLRGGLKAPRICSTCHRPCYRPEPRVVQTGDRVC